MECLFDKEKKDILPWFKRRLKLNGNKLDLHIFNIPFPYDAQFKMINQTNINCQFTVENKWEIVSIPYNSVLIICTRFLENF